MDADQAEQVMHLDEAILSDLQRVGLLSPEYHGDVRKMRIVDEGLHLFVPVLARYRVRLVPMERAGCPVRFCTALAKSVLETTSDIAPLRSPIPAGGQGDEAKDAAFGCLGELAERLSLCSLGGSDPRVFSAKKRQPEVDLFDVVGLSADQLAQAARVSDLAGAAASSVVADWVRNSQRRVELRNLMTGKTAQFPSFGVLFQETEGPVDHALSVASTVGCAVWSTKDGARRRAILELVERDAIAQAWYNRLGITFVKPDLLGAILPDQLVFYLQSMPRRWGVYHVASDLPVQVAMAVSHDADGRRCAFGASAGWTFAAACKSALEEMMQSENSLELMEKAYPPGLGPGHEPRQLAYARSRSILEDLPLAGAPRTDARLAGREFSLGDLMQAFADQDMTIWEFDATRADLNIPCIKLLSPELCTWEPRFGKRRLFDGVVKRGLRQHPATEAEFAARPFPF